MNMTIPEEFIIAMMINDIAQTVDASSEDVADDFFKFSAEIDRVMSEEGLTEEEATQIVAENWVIPYQKERCEA